MSRTPTPSPRALRWRRGVPPLVVVLILRCTLYVSVLSLAAVLVVLGYDATVVGSSVAIVATAAAAASVRLTGGVLVANPAR